MLNRHQRRASRSETVLVTKPDDPSATGAMWLVHGEGNALDRPKQVPTAKVPAYVADAMKDVNTRRFWARWIPNRSVWAMGEPQ